MGPSSRAGAGARAARRGAAVRDRARSRRHSERLRLRGGVTRLASGSREEHHQSSASLRRRAWWRDRRRERLVCGGEHRRGRRVHPRARRQHRDEGGRGRGAGGGGRGAGKSRKRARAAALALRERRLRRVVRRADVFAGDVAAAVRAELVRDVAVEIPASGARHAGQEHPREEDGKRRARPSKDAGACLSAEKGPLHDCL
jgi:hypothetical protein